MSFAGRFADYFAPREVVDLSPTFDEVKCTTCYMCACRCGSKCISGRRHTLHRSTAITRSTRRICGKGASGIMQQHSPASSRNREAGRRAGSGSSAKSSGMKRSQPRRVVSSIRAHGPEKARFFTGRDQSQSFDRLLGGAVRDPNFAAHGGFCSVNMAAGRNVHARGSFLGVTRPRLARTRFLMLYARRRSRFEPDQDRASGLPPRAPNCLINPVRTGYSAIAANGSGSGPGTDGLFVLA